MALGGSVWAQQGTAPHPQVDAFPVLTSRQEYLYELSRAVKELAPESHDSHLSALEVRSVHRVGVRELMACAGYMRPDGQGGGPELRV
jgi:hypothetical protein